MNVNTLYKFGDKLLVGGEEKTIISIHIYVSETGKQTERYCLGNEEWLTIKR